MWLSSQFYAETGAAIGGQALEDGLRILDAKAVNEGPTYECFTRTGHSNSNMYRSQSIVRVQWSNYQADDRFGMCFRMRHKKNSEMHWIPAAPTLQDFLAGPATSDFIAVRYNGEAWASEGQLQKQSSNFLAKLTKDDIVAPGLTLHGLRVTFAADIKRLTGANDDQVAAALGDRDSRMGAHYTRHVEQEAKIIQLYATRAWQTRTKPDLENGRPESGKQNRPRTIKPKRRKQLAPPDKRKGGP